MFINFKDAPARSGYFWLASTVTPRPVAWVSSLSASGVPNLAPFSFFQVVTGTPPTLMICPLVNGGDKSFKDTALNIAATGEFVVNLVPHAMVNQMNETSFGYGRETSEFDAAKIESEASTLVKPRRVRGVPVAFECKLAQHLPYPADNPSCVIILGEVVAAHIDESILAPLPEGAAPGTQQHVDPNKLDLVSRMGADWYGRTQAAENFELGRPAGWAR